MTADKLSVDLPIRNRADPGQQLALPVENFGGLRLKWLRQVFQPAAQGLHCSAGGRPQGLRDGALAQPGELLGGKGRIGRIRNQS